MIKIKLPEQNELEIENAVFDFNGTLAVDGRLHPKVKEMITKTKELLNVYILSSDTFESVQKECSSLGVHVEILQGDHCSTRKRRFVNSLGPEKTICIGNGMNDIGMFQICALSIVVIGDEGCSAKALSVSDIAVKDIEDAINLLLNPQRMIATLRG